MMLEWFMDDFNRDIHCARRFMAPDHRIPRTGSAEQLIKDLTVGKPWKTILTFTIPMMLSMIFQQIYSIVDSIIAGNYIGENALAAVGASAPITVLFIAVANGLGMGCSVVVSQIFGAKDLKRLRTAISTSLITVIVFSVVFTIIGIITVNPLMTLLKTPANIFEDAALYLKIYAWGIVFLFIYNVSTAIYTALGDSKTPLYFLIFSSLLNIGLDILFVTTFHMGVAGVAWATFIAQGLSGILCMAFLVFRVSKIKTEGYKKFDSGNLKHIAVFGIPSILQQSFISVGQLFVQGLINSYGSTVVAGFSAGFKINIFMIASVTTLSNALSSYTAQNLGAQKHRRILSGYRCSILMSLLLAGLFMGVYFGFGEQLLRLFVGRDGSADVIKVGTDFLRIVSAFYPIISIKLITDGVLRGIGSMKPFMIGTLLDLVVRVSFSYILSPILGYVGIWWSWPIGWAVGAIAVIAGYLTERKKLTSKIRAAQSQA